MRKSAKVKARKELAAKMDPFLDALMNKLLERLTNLERKMDAILSRVGQVAAQRDPSAASRPQDDARHNQHQQPHRENRIMFEAVCADCQKVCEVPFKPVEGRAIYCKLCFARRKGGQMNVLPKPVAVYQKAAPTSNTPQSKAEPIASAKPSKPAKKSKPAKSSKKKK